MYTINFIGVGRNKASWSKTIAQQPTLPIIERMVRKQKVLMSRDIECLSNESGDGGSICAGMRVVGRYEINQRSGGSGLEQSPSGFGDGQGDSELTPAGAGADAPRSSDI